MKRLRAIGMMTGSSLDAMDAVLIEVESKRSAYNIEVLAFLSPELGKAWKSTARSLAQKNRLRESIRFGSAWSEMAAGVVRKLVRKARLKLTDVDVIGVHGQTLIHLPDPVPLLGFQIGVTFQAVDLSRLAVRTTIPVVGRFRTADLAMGGRGAPLTPYAHRLLFPSSRRVLAIQNLGGIGNVTLLKRNRVERAFDTGPGNAWIDTMARWYSKGKLHFDPEGRFALSGRAHRPLLRKLLTHRYFSSPPPKTAGWEEFGEKSLIPYRRQLLAMSLEDALATVSAATAESIVRAYRKFVFPVASPTEIVLCGGGAKNLYLRRYLSQALPKIRLRTSDHFGFPPEQVEAISFGLFGLETLRGRPINEPNATGAAAPVICGEIALGRARTHVDTVRKLWIR